MPAISAVAQPDAAVPSRWPDSTLMKQRLAQRREKHVRVEPAGPLEQLERLNPAHACASETYVKRDAAVVQQQARARQSEAYEVGRGVEGWVAGQRLGGERFRDERFGAACGWLAPSV